LAESKDCLVLNAMFVEKERRRSLSYAAYLKGRKIIKSCADQKRGEKLSPMKHRSSIRESRPIRKGGSASPKGGFGGKGKKKA